MQLSREHSIQYARPIGFAVSVLGAGFLYWSLYLPLSEAWAGAESLTYSGKLVAMSSAFFILGLLLVAGGPKLMAELRPDDGESKTVAMIVTVMAAAAGAGVPLAVFAYLTSLGYDVSRF
ncbi:MAG: hypothetical protein AAFQ65_13295 [Myxococcota bacterium]